jgi:hypothetical protein
MIWKKYGASSVPDRPTGCRGALATALNAQSTGELAFVDWTSARAQRAGQVHFLWLHLLMSHLIQPRIIPHVIMGMSYRSKACPFYGPINN